MQAKFPGPGTYIFLVEASARRRVQIGALGILSLHPGFYAYVGSAHGPGGLAARLAHHLRQTRSPHWHIDYLRRHTAPREIWFTSDDGEWEHQWAEILESSLTASIPLPRFGASDCRCRSHLFRFSRRPRVSAFRRRSIARAPRDVRHCLEIERWVVT